MHEANFPALHLSPGSQGKTANIVGIYDVWFFRIENLADPPSRNGVPHFSQVPREAVKPARLLLPPKGPVEIVQRKSIHARAIVIFDDLAYPRVQANDHHDMALTN